MPWGMAIVVRAAWVRKRTRCPEERSAPAAGRDGRRQSSTRNKPSSVPLSGEDHSSRAAVTDGLVRPTQDSSGAGRPSSSTWPCSGWGLPCGSCHQKPGALLPHHFTLTCTAFAAIGGLLSAALSVASRRPGVTRHPALRSSDFPPAASRRRSSLAHSGIGTGGHSAMIPSASASFSIPRQLRLG